MHSDKEKGEENSLHYDIENLIKEYGNDVLRISFIYVKNRSDADDIFQEVFVKVFKNIHSFQGNSSIKTWIIRITINTCKDYLKSSWKRKVVGLQEYQEEALTNGDEFKQVENSDRNKFIRDIIMKLPNKYKDIIVCIYYNEMTLEETAKFLNIPVGTVKSRLSRARAKLKIMLEGRIDDEI